MQLGALLQDWTTKDLVEADFKDRIRLRNHHRRGSDTSAKNRVAAALEGSLAIGWEKAVDERVARGSTFTAACRQIERDEILGDGTVRRAIGRLRRRRAQVL
jgi:hypothetical protein